MKLLKVLGYGFLVVTVITILYAVFYAVSSPYVISAAEARRRLDAKEIDLVLDVRTKTERDVFGFFPGSIHIPAGDLDQDAIKNYPNKDVRILVYCNTGQRARAATDKLKSFGFKNVVYIPTSHVSLL